MSQRVTLYLLWVIALSAAVGSLFFSEILKFPPCDLCWYQRIFIYPFVFILPIAMFTHDTRIKLYILSLLIPGAIVAVYHNLLYYGLIEKPIVPCREGVSCTSRDLELFGFIGIPLMSLLAFLAMLAITLIGFKRKLK